MIPLSLYVHIPWCEKKCPYCDFNSHLSKDTIDQDLYIQTLLSDFRTDLASFEHSLQQRHLQSIFIGGGTPSLFDADSFHFLLDELAALIPFANDIEITLEANPGSSEVDKFSAFRTAGINRLSIGIQSFNQQHLTSLGRVHDFNDALNAARYAHDAGFDNFNLDLMFGLPKQTLEQSIADIKQAIQLEPSHLSCYQLTIEPNTLFHHQPPVTPDDETLWDMQLAFQSELANNNYNQYEVSAYSKQDRQCRHNVNYWQFGDYLGIGAGAHGKISNANGHIHRYWKIKHPTTYLAKKDKIGGCDQVSAQQLPFEFMMNTLRLNAGFSFDAFEQRTCLSINSVIHTLEQHQHQGLININNNNVCTTARGRQLLDSLLQDYLPE